MIFFIKQALRVLPLMLICAVQLASAQSGLQRVEWYIDNDPGYGNGTSVGTTAGKDSLADVTVQINPGGLAAGLHNLYLRAQNNNGTWGQDVRWQFVKPFAAASKAPLSQVEYYIDNDPGYGKGQQVSITPGSDSVANGIINVQVSQLTNGQHTLFVRALNSNTTWGHDVKWQFVNSASTLPLSLLNFTGTLQHNNALLNWQTTNEVNTQSFAVERSANGTGFTPLGSVPADNKPGTNDYNYTDANPLQGSNYYRLKMYDKDGAFTYSRIVLLNNGGAAFTLAVQPNPAANNAVIRFNSLSAGKYTVTLASMDGKAIKRITGVAATGANALPMDISGLARGTYMVTFDSADGMKSMKLVKQ